MIKIALVEDDAQDREQINSYLERYAQENGCVFKIAEFANAITFLTNYKPVYDFVFMDIQMPHMNGMDAAAKLREADKTVPLIFITNMSNYAVKGYSVNAVDFVLKPVVYYNFAAMLEKVLRIATGREEEVILKATDEMRRIPVRDIIYVEVAGHKVIYHTDRENIEIWETLKEQESKLIPYGFARCNNYCLVNLKYVDKITGGTVTVKGEELAITRTKKKEFMKKIVEYFGNKF